MSVQLETAGRVSQPRGGRLQAAGHGWRAQEGGSGLCLSISCSDSLPQRALGRHRDAVNQGRSRCPRQAPAPCPGLSLKSYQQTVTFLEGARASQNLFFFLRQIMAGVVMTFHLKGEVLTVTHQALYDIQPLLLGPVL